MPAHSPSKNRKVIFVDDHYAVKILSRQIWKVIKFTACGIQADYYYRTSEIDIKNEPKVQEEMARIFADYDFVKGNPDKEVFSIGLKITKKLCWYKRVFRRCGYS